jgi:hypothetical protein
MKDRKKDGRGKKRVKEVKCIRRKKKKKNER